MSPERSAHALTKFAVQTALAEGIRAAGLVCIKYPDGMTVRITNDTAHEPDALAYCGPKLPDDAIEVPNPVIVVEVLPPSARRIDASAKLKGYFSSILASHLSSITGRQPDGTILTRIVSDRTLYLDPPGFEIAVSGFDA